MRKLLFICLIAVLISCDKEDPKPATLVGTWEITDSNIQLMIGDQTMKEYLISQGYSEAEAQAAVDELQGEFEGEGELKGTFVFKDDGSFVGTTMDGDDPDSIAGTWKLSDDRKTLTLTDSTEPSESFDATVTSLTDTELKFQVKSERDPDDDFPLDFILELTFKRI